MVKKYPSTVDELKQHREHVPASEIKFFKIIDALNDNWHVWHSVRWDKQKTIKSGEADYLVFNPELGFIVLEVKGGLITIEDGIFYTTNTKTYDKFKLKDPFDQAENSMHHIREYYVQKAKIQPHSEELLKNMKWFPLSFNHAVFFPNCEFKQDFEYLQYSFNRIFDESDLEKHLQWQGSQTGGISPLESFLVNLLAPFMRNRVVKPKVADFFPKLIGSNISRYVNLRKYYDVREEELEDINQVQDFLLNALSEKKRIVFKGSAGSGKTYIAMKKAIEQYKRNKSTLLLCFNSELRDSMRSYISNQLQKPYDKIKGRISVFSINLFLRTLSKAMFDSDAKLMTDLALSSFSYEPIASEIWTNKEQIPISYLYDAIIVDEAQDIDLDIRKVLSYFLKDQTSSIFYIFYDEEQALFTENFSIDDFGMEKTRDLITLNRNLRNTIEIANWLQAKTSHGHYDELSGINGFKISAKRYQTSKEALKAAVKQIKYKYITQGINLEKIAILSYYKLRTLIPESKTNSYCDYCAFTEKKSGDKVYLVEPNNIGEMGDIKRLPEINSEACIMVKTISSFKGLESDVLFLVLPNLEDFKEKHPDKYKNFLMQIYVGASRAKFKLYFFEY